MDSYSTESTTNRLGSSIAWRNLFAGKHRDKAQHSSTSQSTTVAGAQIRNQDSIKNTLRSAPNITQGDVGRPVCVRGYGPGILMYWGVYHRTNRRRAGVVFNRPIGLNNGIIEGKVYFRCPEKHGVLVSPAKISFLSPSEISKAKKSGQLVSAMGLTGIDTNDASEPRSKSSISAGIDNSVCDRNATTSLDNIQRQTSVPTPLSPMNRMDSKTAADTVSISSAFSIVSLTGIPGGDENVDTFSISSRVSVCSSLCQDFVHVPMDS